MRVAVVLISVFIAACVFGLTVKTGFEGPSLLRVTLESDSGLYLSFGTSPPITVFGSKGTWSFSMSGGYAHPISIFVMNESELRLVLRSGLGGVVTESFYIVAIPGLLAEVTWRISSIFRLGVQAGISVCLFVRFEDLKPSSVPVGQIGIHARF